MRTGIIKTAIMLLVLAAAAGGGYFLGVRTDRTGNEKQAEEAVQADNTERGTKVAIVNLDEGVDTDSGWVQYAAQLLPYTKVDYIVTGLQDARLGVESGLYGSYVIIPSNFSQTVYSVNAQPAVSRLSYTVSAELDGEKREEAFRNVNELGEYLNNSLTEIYLSSVMKEFHRAQDVTDEIMANDNKDAELLEAVDGGSLVTMVELPEIVQVENTVTELDLAEQYTNNENLLSSLGTSYQGFLTRSQEDIDRTKARSEELTGRMSTVGSVLADANRILEEITFEEELTGVMEKGETVKADIEAVIDQYDAYIDEHNEEIEAANESQGDIREIISGYETVEAEYQKLLEDYISKSEKDHYAFIDQDAYIEKLAEALETVSEDDIPASVTEWKEFLTLATAQMQEEEYCRQEPVIPDYEPGQDDTGESAWPKVQPAKKISEVSGEGETNLETAILDHTDSMMEFVKTEIMEMFGGKTDSILGNYTQMTEQYQELETQAGELNEELGGYDMASYVDEQEVDTIERDMDANLRDVETEVSEYTEAYGEYVSDVYKAADDNLTAMQERVEEAQERSETLLTEGLEEAKISRSENNKVNNLLLGELSAKLPYTRIGGVENKEVYSFMASPLQMEEQEPEPEQQKNGSVKQETEDAEKEEGESAAPAVIFILIGLIVLAGIITQIVSAGRSKQRSREF